MKSTDLGEDWRLGVIPTLFLANAQVRQRLNVLP